MATNNSTSIVEAYISIRSRIVSMIGGDSRSKILVVSSPSSGDGKTTTAINLAIAFSQLGKKVLIIDCDMRRGAVAKRLRLSSMFGLSDILSGDIALDQAIVSNGAVDVISSGKTVADPEQLLSKEQFSDLVSSLKLAYDYVIIDSPSICEFNDTLYTTKGSDGLILVLREGVSSYKKIDTAMHLLSGSNIRLLGTVINATKK